MTVAEYLLKFWVSLALVYIFYWLVLRPLTFYQWNRFYLLIYSLLSFALPFANITPWIREKDIEDFRLSNRIPAKSGNYAAQSNLYNQLSSADWLFVIGAAGSLVLIVRMLIQLVSFRQVKKKSAMLFRRDNIRIYQNSASSSTFSFGNAVYLNPSLHSEEEVQRIIQHEMVHVRQRHTIDIMFGEFLCIMAWYNPFCWLIRYAIRQNLEFIADNNVLLKGYDKEEYQYLLLKVVGAPQYSIASYFNLPDLKKRIIMMNKLKSARLHLTRFLFILPMLAVLLLAFRSGITQQPMMERFLQLME